MKTHRVDTRDYKVRFLMDALMLSDAPTKSNLDKYHWRAVFFCNQKRYNLNV